MSAAVSFDVDYFVSLEDDESEEVDPMGYSFILDQLAQGSAPPPHQPIPFDVLVLTAMEYQPDHQLFKDTLVIKVPLDDSIPSRDEVRRALAAAHQIVGHVKHGRRVLTTCFAGRNRSGLVNGLALIELGYSALDAVALIKNARGESALSNHFFVQELHAHARSRGRVRQPALV